MCAAFPQINLAHVRGEVPQYSLCLSVCLLFGSLSSLIWPHAHSQSIRLLSTRSRLSNRIRHATVQRTSNCWPSWRSSPGGAQLTHVLRVNIACTDKSCTALLYVSALAVGTHQGNVTQLLPHCHQSCAYGTRANSCNGLVIFPGLYSVCRSW